MRPPKIGLLPLYVALYDEMLPALRDDVLPFLAEVNEKLQEAGLDVVDAPVCCTRGEVQQAVCIFEAEPVDLIITLHLAYSPSLESAAALAASPLPILLLDTTPDLSFGPKVDPMRLLRNHGIHGVQDLACMLRRMGKRYSVVAGHLSDPHVLSRVQAIARGAQAAAVFRRLRVLRMGPTFPGMGDFQIPDPALQESFGIDVVQAAPEALLAAVEQVSAVDIEMEIIRDHEAFAVELDPEVHRRSVRLGLGLRRFLEEGGFGAFSMNFLAFDLVEGPLATVPFLECCKAMARGVGYAGEGDVLTAALVAALDAGMGPTTFTEMFCADWAGESIFLSHMGEFNPAVAAGRPRLYEKDFPFTPTQNPATLACAPRSGPATLVNMAPGPKNTFSVIVAPVEVLEDGEHPDYKDWIRGWIRPAVPVAEFLETYSKYGGTHHCALVFEDCLDAACAFAQALGMDRVVIAPEGTR